MIRSKIELMNDDCYGFRISPEILSIKGLKILIVQEKPLKYGYLSLFLVYKTNDEGLIKFSLRYAVSGEYVGL